MRTYLATALKIVKVFTFILLTGVFYLSPARASHIVGGEITYQWVSGNTYTVQLSFYRDCSGIPASFTQTINYSSMLCGLNGSFMASQTGLPEEVSPICTSSLINSSCNGGILYGVEKYIYEGIVTLPGNCSDWEFSYNECCRNNAITNLLNSGGIGSYFSAKLNNLDVPFNNSISFGNTPFSIININTTTQLSWNTYDTDGDSLTYELVPARDFNVVPVNIAYSAGYTYMQPFLSSLPTNLNFSNGILEVSPNQIQVCVVCMKITEYRNGITVGEVYRDYQIVVDAGTNIPPALSGINNTNNYVISSCPGDTITFDVFGSDPDIGQNVLLSMSNISTTATFNSISGTNPVGTFSWIPVLSDVSATAYTYIITANDDNCDYYGTFSKAYQVYVNGCNTNDVWPGDANADGDVNLYDLLPIGIAFNDNGPVRPSASLSWLAQPSPNWINSFTSGINHKHADTDGNGVVDFSDTTAIFQNYGLNHPLRLVNPAVTTVTDLTVTASADTVGLSSIVNFDIAFSSPADSIYALAFRLYFDPAMIDVNSISVTYAGSVFGTNGIDMIKIDRSQGMNGFTDIALTRINQNNITGSGNVARVTIVTTDNVSGKVVLNVAPFDIAGITVNEFPVPFSSFGTHVVIDPNFVGVPENDTDQLIVVYPTPANESIDFVYSGTQKVDYISLFNLEGKEVLNMTNPGSKTKIDIKALPGGTYFLKAAIGDKNIYKKIMVF